MLCTPKKNISMIKGKSLQVRKNMNLIMWDILSLNRTGAFKKLKDELHKCKLP